MMQDQIILIIVGAVFAVLQGGVIMGFAWMHRALVVLIGEMAGIKVQIASIDKDEIARQRHRITQIELHNERIDAEIRAIKDRCRMFHNQPAQIHE
jgi:hypothetical protein